jgi:hypothetical protein
MRRSRCSGLVLASLICAARPALAQTTPTVEGGAFLLLPVGARATALGQAAVADGGSTEALFWNPAGLADVRHSEAALHYYSFFLGTGSALVASVPAAGLGTFTAGAYLVDYGDIDLTTSGGGPPVGRVSPRNVALYASYATMIAGGVAAGITYKLVQFRVDCSGSCGAIPTAVGTTHALDFGVQWALPGALPLVVGAAVRNVGFKLQVNNEAQADPLPARLAIGVAWEAFRPVGDTDRIDLKVLVDLEGSLGPGSVSPQPLIGLESGVRDLVRIRAGYAFLEGSARGPSLGIGFKLGRAALDLAKTFYAADAIGEKEPVHVSFRLAL